MVAGKAGGQIPQAVRRRRNKDHMERARGERRGQTVTIAPSELWRTDVRNYFNAVLNSGQADFYENSDVMTLYLHCEMLDRVLRGARTEPVFEREEQQYETKDGRWETRWVPVLDEDGQPIPVLDEWGKQERKLVGSVNGQALKAVLDMGSELMVTEGSRRRLRIDLGMPKDDEEPPEKAIVAKQRQTVAAVKS